MLTQKDLFQHITISDCLFTKSLLFAKVTLSEDEYKLYIRLFEIVQQNLVHPQILIYLHAPIRKLQENIKNAIEDANKEYPMHT